MGTTISVHETEQAARRRSKTIDDSLEADRLRQARTVRVLMLGLSGAGKSTLAKQVRLIHDQGFTDGERNFYHDLIRRNLASSVLHVLSAMDEHGVTQDSEEMKKISSLLKQKLKAKDSSKTLLDLGTVVNNVLSRATVWDFLDNQMPAEDSISSSDLFRSTSRILSQPFIPSDEDMLRARHKTTGLNEVIFNFKGLEFRLCDVDGHSSIKSKWLQNFDSVSAIIYTASLGSYVIKSREKDNETELHDAIRAFQTVTHFRGFESTPILLFLNKLDVFQKQLTRTPLSTAFHDYKGKEDDIDEATDYIRDQFLACIEPKDRLTTHVTSATDTSHIRNVFELSLAVIVDNA